MGTEDFIKGATNLIKRHDKKLEVDAETKFTRYAKACKCKALKLVLVGLRGFPDRTILCPEGRVFFIEFKRKGGKVTSGQRNWKSILTRLGFECYVCYTYEEAKEKLDNFLTFSL